MQLDSNTITSTFWTIIAMMFVYVGLATLDIVKLPDERAGKYLFAGTLFFIGASIFTKCTRWGGDTPSQSSSSGQATITIQRRLMIVPPKANE